MKYISISTPRCIAGLAMGMLMTVPVLSAQTVADKPALVASREGTQHLRSRMFVYSLRDHQSHLVYTADSIWEAPNWSPDGKYLISNHDGAIYKLVLKPDGSAEPQKLASPAGYNCNNDKALSPDGMKLAFSASPAQGQG